MKKIITTFIALTLLIVLTINAFAVVDFNSNPNQSDIYDGYSYCLWWNAYGYNFDIGIEVSYDPPVYITMQSVIEYTDGSYDLYLDCTYTSGICYSQAYKDLLLNSNKQVQGIHFEFHIWEDSHYQTTILKSFYY